MTSWNELEKGAPRIAAAARRMLGEGVPVGFVATLAPDGSPRIAPFCQILTDDALYLIAARHTPKTTDLRRDPRCAIHWSLSDGDEELALRGAAQELHDPEERKRAQTAAHFHFDPADPVFHFSLDHALWVHWENPGTAQMRAIRERWRA